MQGGTAEASLAEATSQHNALKSTLQALQAGQQQVVQDLQQAQDSLKEADNSLAESQVGCCQDPCLFQEILGCLLQDIHGGSGMWRGP